MATLCLLTGSIVSIMWGIINIFFIDTAWEFQKMSNDMAGRESKRTKAWETTTKIFGVGAIVLGVVLFVMMFNPNVYY